MKFTICADGTWRMQVELRCAVLVIVAAGGVAPNAARHEAEVGIPRTNSWDPSGDESCIVGYGRDTAPLT
jgi:hypothetical protein